MHAAPIIAISALLVGFVLLAFSLFAYQIFAKRRKYLEQLAKRDLDPKSPTRVLTVMDGKVVPMQERRRAGTLNGIPWPRYSTDQRGAETTEQPSRNIARDLEVAGNENHPMTADIQPQLYHLQQASDLLGCPVYSPLEPRPRIHAAHAKKKKGQNQLEQTQPPKYSYPIRSSMIKACDAVSPSPLQQESHIFTTPSQLAVQGSTRDNPSTSMWGLKKPISAYSLPMGPRASLSTTGLYKMRTRKASDQRPDSSARLTIRESNPGSIPVPLRSLPPIVKDLPLSPIRTPEDQPATPVRNSPNLHPNLHPKLHPNLHPESPKPNIDMSVLEAASVSAIPHSAFHPYRFPRSGTRQPRKSYRAILKATHDSDSLPIEGTSECGTETRSVQVGTALSSDAGRHRALSVQDPILDTTKLRPQTTQVSSNSIQSRPPDPNATLEHLSWLADPSVDVSPKSSRSSQHQRQPQPNTAETSGESDLMLHKSFLNLDTARSEVVPDMVEEKHESFAGPGAPPSSSNIAPAFHMGNARCISIYSRYATPVSRKAVPSALVREPHRLSSVSSWRDKALPSPRSDQSGNVASATAQSFVVSPLSSVFLP
ncbi:hypothetical protein MMC11_001236 [Xylographa trunciseda]|nr:hypothetical protein [Xylographa trunciseda]